MMWALLLVLLATPAQARDVVECATSRGPDPRWWSWREVDGRKCWYVGAPNKPKSELYWRVNESPLRSAQVQRRAEPTPPAPPASREEVMPHATGSGSLGRGTGSGGGSDNATPAPVDRDELMARAQTNLVLLGQERLRERAVEPWPEPAIQPQRPLPAAPHLPVQEQMPIWLIALIFLIIAGIAFVLPLLPRRTQWPTSNRK